MERIKGFTLDQLGHALIEKTEASLGSALSKEKREEQEFLGRQIGGLHGFDPESIDAMSEVMWRALLLKRLLDDLVEVERKKDLVDSGVFC